MPRRGGQETFPCPACGKPVPEGAISCRACGADEATGWKEDAETETQELDLEQHLDDERYEEFLKEDLGQGTIEPTPPRTGSCLLIVVAVLAVAILLAWLTHDSKR